MRYDEYRIGAVEESLLRHWTEQGYEKVGNILRKISDRESARLVRSQRVPLRIVGGGAKYPRLGFSKLIATFGKDIVEEANFVAVTIRGKRYRLSIRKTRKVVEIPQLAVRKLKLRKGQEIGISLYRIERIVDEIKINVLVYETYVRGQYEKKGKIERRIDINGTLRISLGQRAPTGLDEGRFWEMVYDDLYDVVVTKFKDEYEFDINIEMVGWTWFVPDKRQRMEQEFPNNFVVLRNDASSG